MGGDVMDLILEGVIAGSLGTVAMDLGNLLFARAGIVQKIDVGMIGRMAAGWTRGRFFYRHPSEMAEIPYETFFGYLTHFGIGIGLAVPYLLVWSLTVGGPASPGWAVVYGLATTLASWLFVYPCMGFGAFGRWSPDGPKASLSPLANHFFYGIGLAAGVALL